MNAAERTRYLQRVIERYGVLRIPGLNASAPVALEQIYQPLQLRAPIRVTVESDQRTAGVVAKHANDALEQSGVPRMIVLGGPGMGKTTALAAIAVAAAHLALNTPDAPLPIVIALPDLAASTLPLADYLERVARALDLPRALGNDLWEAVQQGKGVLCLDGLDEVAPALRPTIIALINAGAARWGGSWIIGSRFTDYKGGQFAAGQFAEWELLPLDRAARAQLANQLLPAFAATLHQPLHNQALRSFTSTIEGGHLRGWGENPLLLTLAAGTFVRLGRLPASRAELYRDALDIVLTARVADPAERVALTRLAAPAALRLFVRQGRSFTRADLRATLDLPPEADPEATLDRLLTCGLCDRVTADSYAFFHLTLQEYLAAVALAALLPTPAGRALAWSKYRFSRWSEVLRLMVGICAAGTEAERTAAGQWLADLAAICLTHEGDPGLLGMRLALESLQELPADGDVEIARPVVRTLIAISLGSNVSNVDNSDVWNKVHRPEVPALQAVILEELQAAMHGPLPRQLDVVFRLHRRFVVPPQLQEVIRLWEADESPQWRQKLIFQCANNVLPLPINLLKPYIQQCLDELVPFSFWHDVVRVVALTDQDTAEQLIQVRISLAPVAESPRYILLFQTIGALGQRLLLRFFEQLILQLPAIQQAPIWQAFRILQRMEPPPLPLFIAFLAQGRPEEVRRGAARALGELFERQADEQLMNIMLTLLTDRDDVIQGTAKAAISERLHDQGNAEVADLMKRTLYAAFSDLDPQLRAGALGVAKYWKAATVMPTSDLLWAFTDVPEVKVTLIHCLVRRADAPLAACVTLLDDADEAVRHAAKQQLPDYIAIASIDEARQFCQSPHALARSLGARGAAFHHDLPLVERCLADAEASVLAATLEAAGAYHVAIPLSTLLTSVNHADEDVQIAAIKLLGGRAGPVVLAVLLELIESDQASIAESALEALASVPVRIPPEGIWRHLRDTHSRFITFVAQLALRQLDDFPLDMLLKCLLRYDPDDLRTVFPQLLEAAEAQPQKVLLASNGAYRLALDVVRHMGDRAPNDILMDALDDQYSGFQAYVIEIIGEIIVPLPVERLIQIAQHGRPYAQSAAIGALATLGSAAPLDVIMAPLQAKSTSGILTRAAVAALERLGDAALTFELIAPLLDHTFPAVKWFAAGWLQRSADPRAAALLAERVASGDAQLARMLEPVPPRERSPNRGPVEALSLQEILARFWRLARPRNDESRDPEVWWQRLARLDQPTDPRPFLNALYEGENTQRYLACLLLERMGWRVPRRALEAVLLAGQHDVLSRYARWYPAEMQEMEADAITVLRGGEPNGLFRRAALIDAAQTIQRMHGMRPNLLRMMSAGLASGVPPVQIAVCDMLQFLPRSIDDATIRQLYQLRLTAAAVDVRRAADVALGAILAIEGGLEDE